MRHARLFRTANHPALYARSAHQELVARLGGDANIPALYSAWKGVRPVGSVVGVWDDVRCFTDGGRYYFPGVSGEHIDCGAYTGLDGASKASFMLVLSPTSLATNNTVVAARGTTSWRVFTTSSGQVSFYGSASGHAVYDFTPFGGISAGDRLLVCVQVEGPPASGRRVGMWATYYSASTDSWGPLTALTRVSDSCDTTITNADDNLRIGARNGGATEPHVGFIDDVRIFENVALTQTQFQAELDAFAAKSSTSPNSASKWYSFDGNANNIGAVAGNNGTPTSNVVLCSDDCRWGPSLASAGTNRPAYANGLVTFDGVNDYLRGFRGRLGDIVGSCGVVAVAKAPVSPASGASIFYLSNSSTTVVLRCYTTGSNVTVAQGAATIASGVTPDALLRPYHSRRTQVAGNDTIGIQRGSGVEVTGTGAEAAASATRFTVGANLNDSPGNFGASSVADLILFAGDYSGEQSLVNAWAQGYPYAGAVL